jgi:biopolymer transport protein TolQ
MSGESGLSAWDLILSASLLVQGVMALLVAVSVVSWVIIYVKAREMAAAGRAEAAFSASYQRSRDLEQVLTDVNREPEAAASGSAAVLRAGYYQCRRLMEEGAAVPEVREAGRRAMRVAVSEHIDRLDRYLAFLAVVASAAPFVGLFGTVWGIMNSFQNIGAMGQATLAVVAPGIAEALIATAFGLGAAIPAVVAYNLFTRRVERQSNRLENFADDLTGLFERQARH